MMRRLILSACLVLAAAVPFGNAETHEGYYAPIYSSDGQTVYFITRTTQGITWGIGAEFFTPPAHAVIFGDQFRLQTVNLQTGEIRTLQEYPPSPLVRKHLREYRGGIFTIPRTRLRLRPDGRLTCTIGVPSPVIINSARSTFWLTSIWDEKQQSIVETNDWHEGYENMFGTNQSPLSGDWEVVAVPGQEGYPAAIVTYNHIAPAVHVLIKNKAFGRLYPKGLGADVVAKHSQRSTIERFEHIQTTYQALTEDFQAEGMNEGTARLQAGKEMERVGYFPKKPTLTARLLTADEAQSLQTGPSSPLFVIERDEMRSGIFQDIERALDNPGTPVDKATGSYVIHRDYNNSQKLNEWLASGGVIFYVQYQDRTYELRLTRSSTPVQ